MAVCPGLCQTRDGRGKSHSFEICRPEVWEANPSGLREAAPAPSSLCTSVDAVRRSVGHVLPGLSEGLELGLQIQ